MKDNPRDNKLNVKHSNFSKNNLIERTLQLTFPRWKQTSHSAVSEFEQELGGELWKLFSSLRGFKFPDGAMFIFRSECVNARGYIITVDINDSFMRDQLLRVTLNYETPHIVPLQVRSVSILFSNYLAHYTTQYYDHEVKVDGRPIPEIVEEVAEWTAKYLKPVFEAHGLKQEGVA